MEKECILTVSVAAYNVEKYLREALEPFACDKYDDKIEVLIISDGATDNTDAIAYEYEKKFPRIFKLVKKNNGGWGSTLNKGISIAKGKYFKQLDGDDYFSKDTLEQFVDFLSKTDEDLIVSAFSTFDDESGSVLEVQSFDEAEEKCVFPMKINQFIKYYERMYMHAACIKTQLLRDNNIMLEEHCFYTDVEFMVKSIACVKTVNLFNKTVYMYRLGRNGQSISLLGFEKHYKEHQKVALKLTEFCEKYQGDNIVKKAIISRTMDMVIAQYGIYLMIGRTKQHKDEFAKFDRLLEKTSAEMYRQTCIGKKIALLRISRFHLYNLVWKISNRNK